ncbi:phage tail protein [Citrobacter braakii]|uniref:phage tail protein n=1 Tax=Citrobacter braakii TaxID=57706 RepID=UPI000B9B1CEB|nr:phage tail protein [Citrobacter braakii]
MDFLAGGTNVAFIGFGQDSTDNLTFSNRKTNVALRVGNEVSVNGSRVLTDKDTIIPIGGTILWNNSSPIPPGFLPNEGRTFSASDYPDLAKIFTNLKLPDDRGYAIRAADNGRGVDPGRTAGSYQEDAVQNIVGEIPNAWVKGSGGESGALRTMFQLDNQPVEGSSVGRRGLSFDASRSVRTASETRGKNVSKILITRVK